MTTPIIHDNWDQEDHGEEAPTTGRVVILRIDEENWEKWLDHLDQKYGTVEEELARLQAAGREAIKQKPTRQFGSIVSTNMGGVVPDAVPWLWPGRISLGMLSIVAGPPGVGKSYVSLDIAARITRGDIWPDVGKSAPEGTVVLLAAEDSAKFTIKPRLDALRADSYRVEKIDAVMTDDGTGRKTFSLADDITALERMVKAVSARIVIVDPVNSYLGGKTDGFKDTEVRGVLDPLKEMAERLEVAVVLLMHLKKGEEAELIYRIGGSVAFGAVVRSIFLCAQDEEQPGRVYFTHAKINVGPTMPTLAYRILPDSSLEWGKDPIKLTAAEVMSQTKRPGPAQTARKSAKRWLLEYLADGPRPAADGYRDADEADISDATLRRALKDLGVVSAQARDPKTGQVAAHTWSLPPRGDGEPF